MKKNEVVKKLKTYFQEGILEGKSMDLDQETSLFEWGVINSYEISKLMTFLASEYQIEVPMEEMMEENFQSLSSISNLVLKLKNPE